MRTLVTVSGNLTNQPVARHTKDGVQVVEFGLACNSRRQDRSTGLWEDGEPSFFTVTCWRRLAENVVVSLHKGDPVLVHARFSTREYTRSDGTVKVELKLEAQSVGPDLGRSIAIVRRTTTRIATETPVDGAPASGAPMADGPDGAPGPVPDPGALPGQRRPAGSADPEIGSAEEMSVRSGPLVAVPAAER